jgi:hypothetical protein
MEQGAGLGCSADLDVDIVEASRLGADQDLPGPGLGNGGLLDNQDLGATMGVIAYASHCFLQLDDSRD